MIRLPKEEVDCVFSRSSTPFLGLTEPSLTRYGLTVLCKIGRPTSAEVKNARKCTYVSPYV